MNKHNSLYLEFANVFARTTAYCANFARECGWAIPDNYELGASVIETRDRGQVVKYRLRMNDVTVDVALRFPDPGTGVSRYTRDHRDFMNRIEYACGELILKYAEAHGLQPSLDTVRRLEKAGVYEDKRLAARAAWKTAFNTSYSVQK